MSSPADGGVQSNISAYWSRHADSYDAHQLERLRHDEVHQTWLNVWRRALPPPPATVLDVGTGTGHVSLLLAELGYSVYGIDLAEGMLDHARAKAARLPFAPPILTIGDAVAPDFPPHSFDVITARYMLWTLRTPAIALANWRQLLRPGGRLTAVDSTWFPDGIRSDPASAKEADFQHLYDDEVLTVLPLAQAISIDATADLVREAGFADVTVTALDDVLELDRKYGVAPGHHVQTQYLITALNGD